jgi:hypothetical protein
LTANLRLAGLNPNSSAEVYTYSGANLGAIVRQPNLSINPNGFQATYPANSITLVAIPTAK